MENPWKTIRSKAIYRNPWFRVREDDVIRPDGKAGIYGVVEFAPSVGVLALNERDEVALVRQWRYTKGAETWELPIGSSKPTDASMEEAAQRELREETGVEATHWERLGVLDCIVGATTERATLFRATGLRTGMAEPDPEEAIAVEWVSFARAMEMVTDGTITECISVAALLREGVRRGGKSPV
jgi:8-oxo-dGTP pyrophosphatase MutT (NUDIX family)